MLSSLSPYLAKWRMFVEVDVWWLVARCPCRVLWLPRCVVDGNIVVVALALEWFTTPTADVDDALECQRKSVCGVLSNVGGFKAGEALRWEAWDRRKWRDSMQDMKRRSRPWSLFRECGGELGEMHEGIEEDVVSRAEISKMVKTLKFWK
jgi:hypothetical protein